MSFFSKIFSSLLTCSGITAPTILTIQLLSSSSKPENLEDISLENIKITIQEKLINPSPKSTKDSAAEQKKTSKPIKEKQINEKNSSTENINTAQDPENKDEQPEKESNFEKDSTKELKTIEKIQTEQNEKQEEKNTKNDQKSESKEEKSQENSHNLVSRIPINGLLDNLETIVKELTK